jgi:hypothetical protein
LIVLSTCPQLLTALHLWRGQTLHAVARKNTLRDHPAAEVLVVRLHNVNYQNIRDTQHDVIFQKIVRRIAEIPDFRHSAQIT